MFRTVSDLLAAVEQLPEPERRAARARIEAALDGDARSCRAALGVLALDLAGGAPPRLEVRVHLDELTSASATA